jgi:hypothetical protein
MTTSPCSTSHAVSGEHERDSEAYAAHSESMVFLSGLMAGKVLREVAYPGIAGNKQESRYLNTSSIKGRQ